MALKVGDKVECGFNAMSDEDREAMVAAVEKNFGAGADGKPRGTYKPEHQTEPELGIIEAIVQDANGKHFQVRIFNPDGTPGPLRNYAEDKLEAV